MSRTLVTAGILIAGILVGVLLSPTVFGGFTGFVQEMQPPSVSGKRARASAVNAAAVAAQTYSEQQNPGPVILTSVRDTELGDALASMGLRPEGERAIDAEIRNHGYRLLWLTLWDWDGDEVPDYITIASGDYKRQMQLSKSRKTIAIPAPPSHYIEISGEPHNSGYEGWTTVALLSGQRPIALSRLVPGKSLQIEIDTAD